MLTAPPSQPQTERSLGINGVIYVRVSTEDQVDNYSLTTQQQACEDYCARKGRPSRPGLPRRRSLSKVG